MAHLPGELGLDYAWTHVPISAMHAGGYRFAMRYLSWLPNGKVIGKNEFNQLLANDIAVGMNWEYDTSDQLRGAPGGRSDAAEAKRQMKALGTPAGKVCYFSADWDVAAYQLPTLRAYWAAANAVLSPEYRFGVYGGHRAVTAALDLGYFGWQTYAWSYGVWDPRTHIRQTLNGIRIGGVDCDRDQLKKMDAGLVGLSTAPAPTPVPIPTPTPVAPYRYPVALRFMKEMVSA